MEIKVCKIPVSRIECEEKRIKCSECPYRDNCDMFWISELWTAENKKSGKDTLLGPFNPAFTKPDIRANHIISITGKYDFCCFNNPKSKDYIVIGDIYVDEAARGQGISKKILNYLMETYDKDIFAKCVKGTSAEAFWSHLGEQLDANEGRGPDMYEHRVGKDGKPKRDLSWYIVKNVNKKENKETLW